ncbi:hypothetical protein L0222_29205 [bacterium]|nr:hypothetical protein [bacterium]MCI0601666.1 hypothetical protein [bacterium]
MQSGDVFRNRNFYILVGLVFALIVVNFRQWNSSSGVSARSREQNRVRSHGVSEDPLLISDKLKEEREPFDDVKRNIFSFFNPGPPPPTPEQIAAAQEAARPPDPVCGNGGCEAGEDITNCPQDCTPPPPPVPQITLRYIGYLSEPKGPVVFLTDGKEVYMGRVNDVIANQYRVLKISEDSVELGFLDNNQSSTIRFQGNQGG